VPDLIGLAEKPRLLRMNTFLFFIFVSTKSEAAESAVANFDEAFKTRA
jgi:hypothetical protein